MEPTQSQQVGWAGGIGAVAGLAMAGGRGSRWRVVVGAGTGAVVMASAEAVARHRQRANEIPALWSRILSSGALAAPVGWAVGRVTGAGPVAVATGAGAVAGAMGLRPQKVVLGPVFGAAMGRALAAVDPRHAGSGGGRLDGCRLPDRVGRRVPGCPDGPAGGAGEPGRPALRRAPRVPHPVCRHRLRPLAGRGARRDVRPRRARRRHRGVPRLPSPDPTSTRPRSTPRSAGSTSTPAATRSTSSPSGGGGSVPGTSSTGRRWHVPWARPTCR